MSEKEQSGDISRRLFLQGIAGAGGTAVLGKTSVGVQAATSTTPQLPTRILGRTNCEVSALTLGTWPCGKCETIDTRAVADLVHEALELGITFIDTARGYGNAEEGIGRALGSRRGEVFLSTKVWADDAENARKSFEESLRTLRTDYVDVAFLHSMGNRDPKQVLSTRGALTYLLKQKEAGKTRFVGISGHHKPGRFVPILESGQVDVVLMAMNFVDQHTYGFERKVLPVARRHNVGVACMKVFGGMKGGFGVASGPNPGTEIGTDYLQPAISYAMSLPGVATLVIGPHTVEQLRTNVQMVKNYQPLSDEERTELEDLGRDWSRKLGPHFGPVA